jgi:hypothetical protein
METMRKLSLACGFMTNLVQRFVRFRLKYFNSAFRNIGAWAWGYAPQIENKDANIVLLDSKYMH